MALKFIEIIVLCGIVHMQMNQPGVCHHLQENRAFDFIYLYINFLLSMKPLVLLGIAMPGDNYSASVAGWQRMPEVTACCLKSHQAQSFQCVRFPPLSQEGHSSLKRVTFPLFVFIVPLSMFNESCSFSLSQRYLVAS